ncbi:single stranded DNA-binding domain-containing protein, partial [Microvirga arsenatis]|nr:single-stranded DNA-binding protein [Microvirga arsenatis]
TTEVVLQRFRGELTILDSRGGGSSDYADEEQGQIRSGGDFGRTSPMERRPEPAGSSRHSDFDDDIPF